MNSIHRLTRNVIKEKLLAELFIRSSSNPEMSAINRVEDAQQRDTTQIHLQQAETTERPLWKKFDNGNTNLTRTSVRLAMRSQSYDNSKRQMHFPSHYSRRNIPIDTKDDSFLLPQRKVRSLRHKRYYTVSGANTRTENDFYSFDHFFESVGDSQELNVSRKKFMCSLFYFSMKRLSEQMT